MSGNGVRSRHTDCSAPAGSHLQLSGRVLKQATDATVKDAGRIANYRVFYEADDELLSQSLYRNTYAKGATAREGSWMVVASKGSGGAQMLALEGPAPEPLALMPPQGV